MSQAATRLLSPAMTLRPYRPQKMLQMKPSSAPRKALRRTARLPRLRRKQAARMATPRPWQRAQLSKPLLAAWKASERTALLPPSQREQNPPMATLRQQQASGPSFAARLPPPIQRAQVEAQVATLRSQKA